MTGVVTVSETVNNCPIMEQTADGTRCGRCWHTLEKGRCPRHGDVRVEINEYVTTGLCVIENKMRRRKGMPLLGRED